MPRVVNKFVTDEPVFAVQVLIRCVSKIQARRRFAEENRGVFRLMFGHDVTRLSPDDDPQHPGGRLWHQWLDAVRACAAEGHLRPEGAEQAALHLWSALLGRFALWSTTFGRDDTADPAEFTDYLVDRILTGTTKGSR